MYEDGKDVKYFVSKSGGYKKFADINSIYVLHPNGEYNDTLKKDTYLKASLKAQGYQVQ